MKKKKKTTTKLTESQMALAESLMPRTIASVKEMLVRIREVEKEDSVFSRKEIANELRVAMLKLVDACTKETNDNSLETFKSQLAGIPALLRLAADASNPKKVH